MTSRSRVLGPRRLVAVLALLLLGGACTGGGGKTSSTGSAPSCHPNRGGTVTVGVQDDIVSWDYNVNGTTGGPTPLNATSLVFDPLVRPTDDVSGVEYRLARSITPSDDYQTWTILVRPGVRFQDGRPLTSADVAFTLSYVLHGPFGYALGSVKSIDPVDNLTVRVRLSAPYTHFVTEGLAEYAASVIPNNFGGKSKSDFWRHPYGTGPYKLSSYTPGSGFDLVRNPEYWDRKVPRYIEKIEFKFVPDSNDRILGLEGGDFQLIDRVPPDAKDRLPGDALLRPTKDSTITDALFPNSDNPLLADDGVRRAIFYGIDRQSIIQVLNGLAAPAVASVANVLPGITPGRVVPQYDLQRAKQLMRSSSHPSGGSFSLQFVQGDPAVSLEAQVVQSDLAKLGIHVDLRPLGFAEFFDRAVKSEFDMMLFPNTAVTPDPIDAVGFFVSTKGYWGGWPTATQAKLLGQLEAASAEAQREKIYDASEADVLSNAYVIPLVDRFYIDAQNVKLANLAISRFDQWHLETAWLCA